MLVAAQSPVHPTASIHSPLAGVIDAEGIKLRNHSHTGAWERKKNGFPFKEEQFCRHDKPQAHQAIL